MLACLGGSQSSLRLNYEKADVNICAGSCSGDCCPDGKRAPWCNRSEKSETPPGWESGPGRVLIRACANCHSDHTDWPWYSHVAPVSGWVARHVREGRESMDFSEWETYSAEQRRNKLESICGVISTGRMPPQLYNLVHPEAKLTEKDKSAVCDWVQIETIGAR